MKIHKPLIILLLLFLMVLSLASCGSEGELAEDEHHVSYTCPMHPQIVQQEPGSCPICGMDLVPQAVHGESVDLGEDLDFLLQPTNQSVVANISTISPVMKTIEATVPVEGVVTYDPNRVYSIPARVGGRIEQLLVKYNYQPIQKGQKLMEIYSPELVTAQKELLYLVQSNPEDTQLIEGAKQRLLLLGATREQINQLIRSGEASYTFAIYSPYTGYVIGLNTAPPGATASAMPARSTAPAAGGMAGMSGGASASARQDAMASPGTGEEIQLREGMYITTGQPLLRVVNTDMLWAEFNIPAGYINAIALGNEVTITFPQLPGVALAAKVDFLQPYFEAGENFARLRVYLPRLKESVAMVGQLVSGKVHFSTPPSLWVPKESILDLGTRAVAFVKEGPAFKPVSVRTGLSENGQTQVLEGLQQGDLIASNAQFMVDSESFIRVNR